MPRERTPEEALAMAQKILHAARRLITYRNPILLAPVYTLVDKPWDLALPMATDGKYLFFHPGQVIQDFMDDRQKPARQLLHAVFHCLMGHVKAQAIQSDRALFNDAADWKAAQFLDELNGGFGAPGRNRYGWETEFDEVPLAKMLQILQQDPKKGRSLCKDVEKARLREDSHALWTPPPKNIRDGDGDGGEGEKAGMAGGEDGPDWSAIAASMLEQAKESDGWGSLAGMLEQELDMTEENGISYEQFLRRFASPQERLLLDPDSLDPKWYYVGLELYGDIPLLEPSELSEPPAPDDLVIALDTSGSCSGDVCRRFLRETMNLLRDISAGAPSFRVLVMQCDAEIQKELLLESADQLDSFLEDFRPGGFGGTDFRPVFRRIEALRGSGELPRVKGLLYLSDCYGNFPDSAPEYPVTFLMLRGGGMPAWIPRWVNTLILDRDDFTLKEANS